MFVRGIWRPRETWFCSADGDGAAEGGDGGGSGATGAASPATQQSSSPDWVGFLDGLERLNTQLGDRLGSKLDTLQSTVAKATEPEPPTPPDLDAMTRGELVAHITNIVGQGVAQQLADVLKPLTDQLTSVQTSVATADVNASIKELRAAHPDFNDWKDEMVALSTSHPTLDIRALYTLARGSNMDKARTLDARYNPPKPPVQPRWGGLLGAPASGNGAPPKLSAHEASVEAYREVQARHPDLLRALEAL